MSAPKPPRGYKIVHEPGGMDGRVKDGDKFFTGNSYWTLSSNEHFDSAFYYARKIKRKARR